MKSTLFFLIIIAVSNNLYSQQTDCKVLKLELSGSYSGDCKNGLANGYGIAKGTDTYEGQFKKGKPDGKGKYTWSNGNYYDGDWKDGKKAGKGSMVSKDTTLTGIWKSDKYIGEENIPPYKIIRSINISRPSFKKSAEPMNEIRFRIMKAGIDNRSIENLSIVSSSGSTYNTGYTGGYGLRNVYFPVNVTLQYTTWNKVESIKIDVIFEFEISEAGFWEIIINN
jgi:hypothetical protein